MDRIPPLRLVQVVFARIVIVVSTDISRQLRTFEFKIVLIQDAVLDQIPALRVDGVSNVRVQLGPPIQSLGSPLVPQSLTALAQ